MFLPALSTRLSRKILNAEMSFSTKYGLLTKREVKMVGYLPSSLLASLWTDRDGVEIEALLTRQKMNKDNIEPPCTVQAWSIKNYYAKKRNLSCSALSGSQSQGFYSTHLVHL